MNAKLIRGQLRQIVQELLGEVLVATLREEIVKEVKETYFEPRLRKIESNVQETLQLVNQRSKDSLGYLVRQVTEPAITPTLAPKEAPAVPDED